jgi:hypothetical protein
MSSAISTTGTAARGLAATAPKFSDGLARLHDVTHRDRPLPGRVKGFSWRALRRSRAGVAAWLPGAEGLQLG